MKFIYIFLFAILYSYSCLGQNQIVGKFLNEKKKPVENVNVVLYELHTEKIISYVVSNQNGSFQLLFSSNVDSLRLEINSLGFSTIVEKFPNLKTQRRDYVLRLADNYLNEVNIKPDVLKHHGDTITYSARLISDKSDRSVIDVIKKIPGIKVTDAGQILYNNKAINKFYIEGKDLLGARYTLASNNLQIDAVKEIQVLQNHQPVRLLNGIEQSDRAAINITLNKDAKNRLLGKVHAGIGISPFQSDNAVTLFKFNKHTQYLNLLKYNDVGIDLNQEFNIHDFSGNEYTSNNIRKDYISLVRPSRPPFEPSRYLFSRNMLSASNALLSLTKNLDIRINAGYSHFQKSESAQTKTNIFLLKDTINIDENHVSTDIGHQLFANLLFESNNEKYYIQDELKFEKNWNQGWDSITTTQISQKLHTPLFKMANELKSTIKVGSDLIGVSSYMSFINSPQHLLVNPVQFADLLELDDSYSGLLQKFQVQGLFINNSISFNKQFGTYGFDVKSGVSFQLQKLGNNLISLNNNTTANIEEKYQNEIERKSISVYLEPRLLYSRNQLRVSFGFKVSNNMLGNKSNYSDDKAVKLLTNPNMSVLYKFDEFWSTALTASLANQMNYDYNTTYILQNYRTLVNSDVPLRESRRREITWAISYKNIISAVYSNLNFGYSMGISNIINSTSFTGLLMTNKAVLQNNPNIAYNLSWDISKYYINIKTAFNFALRFDRNNTLQYQQDILTMFNTKSYTLTSKITTNLQKNIVLEHLSDFNVSYTNSKFLNQSATYRPVRTLKQKIVAKYFLPANYNFQFVTEDYFNKSNKIHGNHYLFADISVMKSYKQPKIDISLKLSNIFNVRSYNSFFSDNNTIIATSYSIRPQMLMLSADFKF